MTLYMTSFPKSLNLVSDKYKGDGVNLCSLERGEAYWGFQYLHHFTIKSGYFNSEV